MHYRKTISILLPFLCLLLILSIGNQDAIGSTITSLSNSYAASMIKTSRTTVNLEAELAKWGIFHDQGYSQGKIETEALPGADNQSVLKVSLLTGQPYAGIHAYRDLPPDDQATSFHMKLSFYFPEKKPIQALEFTMNKWSHNVRWEWALQWQAVPDGSRREGNGESWRIWNGTHWQDIKIQQSLAADTWHTLDLNGTIEHGQIHYQSFRCDDKTFNMQSYLFAPIHSPGEKLAVGIQLDGNAYQQPYPVYIDNMLLQAQ